MSMQFGLQNQNQSFFNSFTNNNTSGFFNNGSLSTGSTYASLGSNFTNSPAVQTFGNIGPGSSYGVTQNINYTQPNANFGTQFGGFGGFAAPAAPAVYQAPQQSYLPPVYSMPSYPPQNYYAPQPQPQPYYGGGGYGGGGYGGGAGLIQAIMAPLMQMMTMMIGMFMQNGSYIGPQFPGDIHHQPGGFELGPIEEEIIEEEIIVEDGRVWGDPHFVGAEGGNFDVMGDPGSVYNILSDAGIQFNAQFDEWRGQADATIMSNAGITLGDDQIQFGIDGKLFINGEEVEDGTYLDGKVTKNGDRVNIDSGEWQITLHDNGDHLNYDFASANAAADGVLAHGLFGQTADGDGQARNGDKGKGAQGGGAIEMLDGSISEAGDKETYKLYEVGGLFDTNFENFNKFHHRANPNTPRRRAGANAQGGGEAIG